MEPRKATVDLSTRALQMWLFLLRHESKLTRFLLTILRRRNERSSQPVTAPGGPIVSMTSHGDRLQSVHLVLESIASGSVLPSRLILWVDSPEAYAYRSPGLERLVERGLEIYLTGNFGPHTKYYPYLLSTETFEIPLVTADDDLLYSKWWLEGLVRAHRENPGYVNCYRAHVLRVSNGVIQPYQTWESCETTEPSFLNFATGVSGCIYPPSFQKTLKLAGDGFLEMCPNADDIWLHVNAIRAGIKIRQVWDRSLRFPFVPHTQEGGLYHSNVLRARNDVQIGKTYSAEDIEFLESAGARLYPIPHLTGYESKRT